MHGIWACAVPIHEVPRLAPARLHLGGTTILFDPDSTLEDKRRGAFDVAMQAFGEFGVGEGTDALHGIGPQQAVSLDGRGGFCYVMHRSSPSVSSRILVGDHEPPGVATTKGLSSTCLIVSLATPLQCGGY